MKTLTQDRDNIQLLYEQATDEIQRLRRQVSRARSPSPSRAASAVLVRVESERDAALADVRRSNIQLDNLEDKLKVCCRENPIPSVRLSRTLFTYKGTPPYDPPPPPIVFNCRFMFSRENVPFYKEALATLKNTGVCVLLKIYLVNTVT